ncbi:MAG: hypothetical protein IPM46_03695 [Flavobacteriales bacterium]|nr:hypothetical protein [Flavobacteriales bacterium]
MSIMTGMNNELFTLFIVKEFEGKVIGTEPVTRGQFVQQARAEVPSKANPSRINLFRIHDVPDCYLPPGLDDGRHPQPACGVFDVLWKLRFQEFPFRAGEGQHTGLGWAENPSAPSGRQLLLLSDYGIHSLHDLACGDDLFRLLHDMGDPEWVDNYRKGY